MLESINPATGEKIAEYPEMAPPEVRRALRASRKAFDHWRATDATERAALLNTAAEQLRHRADELARLITIEMGKPISEARAEIEKCARGCEYFARHGAEFLEERTIALGEKQARVSFQPLGPLLAIMPWNFPFWQTFRAAAPALMAGNAVVLKLASNTTGCALGIADVFRAAGFPEYVFTILRLPAKAMARVIRNEAIAAVTLTGSTEAGRRVAAVAGSVVKKTVLELGGSDAYLVLEDADLDLAARVCAKARLINGGQSCIAGKRFIVVDAVREAFVERFARELQAVRMGDPLDEQTQLGPLARFDLRDALHAQVEQTAAAGARVICGGAIPEGRGAFYPPTLLVDVKPGMPGFDDELFGPAAAVIAARNEREAIKLANHSIYGLGGAVFTRDPERALRLARTEIEAGVVAINDLVQSDPRAPFGGVKQSGYGRELAEFGLREFVNVKTILNA